jgi:hypothetical protein
MKLLSKIENTINQFMQHGVDIRFGGPLCANIDETTASPFITVEGTEVNKDGRSWKRAAFLAAAWRL